MWYFCVWFRQYIAAFGYFDGLGFFSFDDLEEPFWTFSYKGRSVINDEIFSLEADVGFGFIHGVPDIRRDHIYSSIFSSPFYSLSVLESVRRLYRINDWFWSPVDLLDKRYYIPNLQNLFFYDLSFKFDLDISVNSLFYRSSFYHNKNIVDFNKNNMFFYDFNNYDNNSLDSLMFIFILIKEFLILVKLVNLKEFILINLNLWILGYI